MKFLTIPTVKVSLTVAEWRAVLARIMPRALDAWNGQPERATYGAIDYAIASAAQRDRAEDYDLVTVALTADEVAIALRA